MARSLRLRRWQKAALDAFLASDGPDFLAVATPGSGKTTFALAAVRVLLGQHPDRRVVIVAPTQHLKRQWAEAAAALDLHLETAWSAAEPRLPADVHGIVTTYQQVALGAEALSRGRPRRDRRPRRGPSCRRRTGLGHGGPAGVPRCVGAIVPVRYTVPVRHAAPSRSWTTTMTAWHDRTSNTGMPTRCATAASYARCRFPRIDGEMEWIASDGTHAEASFGDHLDAAGQAQRLRTALSVEGDWIGDVLARAHASSSTCARTHPRRRALVIAIDQEHARGIAGELRRRCGVDPVVAVSDDAAASRRIAEFADGARGVDRRGPHDLRGRRHSASACRCLCDDHDHRAVFPSGRRPPGALDAGPRPAAVLHVPAR